MASLYVEEFAALGQSANGNAVQAGEQPALAVQKITIDVTSAQSSAFNANTRFVRVHTDATCSYAFGANPTATAGYPRLVAGATEYFGVEPGHKVAVITNA
jgi:hypothetical protein